MIAIISYAKIFEINRYQKILLTKEMITE